MKKYLREDFVIAIIIIIVCYLILVPKDYCCGQTRIDTKPDTVLFNGDTLIHIFNNRKDTSKTTNWSYADTRRSYWRWDYNLKYNGNWCYGTNEEIKQYADSLKNILCPVCRSKEVIDSIQIESLTISRYKDIELYYSWESKCWVDKYPIYKEYILFICSHCRNVYWRRRWVNIE